MEHHTKQISKKVGEKTKKVNEKKNDRKCQIQYVRMTKYGKEDKEVEERKRSGRDELSKGG